jgi:SRSO17 transposase
MLSLSKHGVVFFNGLLVLLCHKSLAFSDRAMARGAMAKRAKGAERLELYCEKLDAAIGHADRREPLRAYVKGLLLPGERKSVEPMAARIDPRRVRARHQSMHHFVASAPWEEREVIRVARDHALEALERHAPIAAWVIDDTGIPKKGHASVGVTRQYCGQLGKQDNCQVVVTLSLANAVMSVPAAYRLYLPEAWSKDRKRCRKAGVPPAVEFRKKWEIALAEIDQLLADDLPHAPVVADAGYGVTTEFREQLTTRRLAYAMGVSEDVTVWPEGTEPLRPAVVGSARRRTGRPRKLLRRDHKHQPVALKVLALGLAPTQWIEVRWREGTKGAMRSRFAATRVRAAHRDYWRSEPRAPEWLLIEWPGGEKEPSRYWLSTVSEKASIEDLVRLVKIRWRIERDYQEMKDELGLGHYEGRGWPGFHHHGALCIAAYAFLAAERARLSPPAPLTFLRAAPLPKGFRARGAPRARGAA